MIQLERFTSEDFDRFISWISSEEEMIQFAGPLFSYPVTHEQLYSYLNQHKKHPFRVKLVETGEIIGHCELNFENEIPRLARILIGNKGLRNRGLGKLIIRELINSVFSTTNYTTIDLNVYDWNLSAIACYQKMGFKINPHVTTTMTVKDKVWNAHNMILNKADYLNTENA